MKGFDLAECATHYYYILDLAEEGDEEVEESWWQGKQGIEEVLKRAFGSSDCGHFAALLHEMTGYQVCNLIGSDGVPIHSFVRTPDGKGLDVHGVSDVASIAKRYGWKGKKSLPVIDVGVKDACGYESTFEDVDAEGFDESKQRLAWVIRNLPWEPFNKAEFLLMARRPLEGVDVPHEAESCVPPIKRLKR